MLYLLKGKLRIRKVKQLAQGHMASICRNGDSDPAPCEAEVLTLNHCSSRQAVRELMGEVVQKGSNGG